jgi:uncharacterized MAPEG superfamily protein
MSIELWALLVAGGMTYLNLFTQSNYASLTLGVGHSMSNRDTEIEESPLAGRIRRSAANGVESVAIFAPLVIVAQFADVSNLWTQVASGAFLVSRLLYFPAYALGLVPMRTLIWVLGFFALPFFVVGILLGN